MFALDKYKLFVSSGNPAKAKEVVEIAEIVFPQTRSLWTIQGARNAVETQTTYEGNAKIKVEGLFNDLKETLKIPFVVLGDDSGLEVSGLKGEPGIFSARYAKSDLPDWKKNIEKVLNGLKDFPKGTPQRRARFVSHLVLGVFESESGNWKKSYFHGFGTVEGEILDSPQFFQGFGYDPIFFYGPSKRTFSQLSEKEKNEISHRRKAFENLKNNISFERSPSSP